MKIRHSLLAILLIGCSHLAHAAFVQQTEVSNATGQTSLTASAITVTAGNVLVVVVSGPPAAGSVTITGGTFTYACSVGANTNATLASTPSSTSATLASPTTLGTGHYAAEFSDNETRWAYFQNGQTGVSWSTALTGSPTTAMVVGSDPPALNVYYELNAAGGSTTIGVTSGTTNLQGLYVAEYSAGSSASFLGCSGGLFAAIANPTSTATTDVLGTTSTPTELIGYIQTLSGTSGATDVTPGTGFTARTEVFGTWGYYMFPEDEVPGSGTSFQASWSIANSTYNTWGGVVLAFGTAGGSCTHDGWASNGTWAIPNGTSGTYALKDGTKGTPNCTSGTPYLQKPATFGVN